MGQITNQQRSSRETARRSIFAEISVLLCILFTTPIARADAPVVINADPHHTPAGFFDLHVCNWTDRPMFFMVVFSTERFAEVKSVDVTSPDGQSLLSMDLSRYRIINIKTAPEKHAFLQQVPLPPDAIDGWYSARITLRNGEQYIAKDYVVLYTMAPAAGLTPPRGAENIPVPRVLAWNPVPGASHYKVYVQNLWEGKLIYESTLLNKPYLDLPLDLIRPGEVYSWRVHARDADKNVLLGDFNSGSFTDEYNFSTAQVSP